MLSALKSFASRLARVFQRNGKSAKPSRRAFLANRARLGLEQLEDRSVPAVFTWTGATDQNWSNPANWTGGAPGTTPTASDDVVFDALHNIPSVVDGLFTGAVDSLTMASGYTQQITLQRDLTVRQTFQLDGSIFGSYSYIVPTGGDYYWMGGTLRGFGGGTTSYQTVISAGSNMYIDDAVVHNLNGRTIQVAGTLNWNAGSVNITNAGFLNFLVGSTFSLPNAINYDLNGDLTGLLTMAGTATVPNNATLTVRIPSVWGGTLNLPGLASVVELRAAATMAGGSQTTGLGQINNYTTVTVPSGTAVIKGGVFFMQEAGSAINAIGSFQISTGSTLQIAGQSILMGAGGVTITATGLMVIEKNVSIGGNFTNNNIVTWNDGAVTINGTFNNSGTFSIDSPNNLTMGGSGVLNNTGSIMKNQLNMVTINNAANNLTVNNPGSVQINQGVLVLQSNWTQAITGVLLLNGGNFQVGGTFTNNGTIYISTTGTIFANSVINNNKIDMRNPVDAVNTLSIAAIPGGGPGGNFSQGAAGLLYLDIYSATDSDRLAVSGTATLNGELLVGLGSGGYQPGGQNPITWNLVSYGQRNGQFAGIVYPAGRWSSNYGAANLSVTWSPN